jgi:hypothetical protein
MRGFSMRRRGLEPPRAIQPTRPSIVSTRNRATVHRVAEPSWSRPANGLNAYSGAFVLRSVLTSRGVHRRAAPGHCVRRHGRRSRRAQGSGSGWSSPHMCAAIAAALHVAQSSRAHATSRQRRGLTMRRASPMGLGHPSHIHGRRRTWHPGPGVRPAAGACAMPNTPEISRAPWPTFRALKRLVITHATVDPSEPATRDAPTPEHRRRDVRVHSRPGVRRAGQPCQGRRHAEAPPWQSGAAAGHDAARHPTPGHTDPAARYHDTAGPAGADVDRHAAAARGEQPAARGAAARRRQSATGRQAQGCPRRSGKATHRPPAAAIIGAVPKSKTAAPAQIRGASREQGAAPRRCVGAVPPVPRGPPRTQHLTVAEGRAAPAGRRGPAQTRCARRHASCTGGEESGRQRRPTRGGRPPAHRSRPAAAGASPVDRALAQAVAAFRG